MSILKAYQKFSSANSTRRSNITWLLSRVSTRKNLRKEVLFGISLKILSTILCDIETFFVHKTERSRLENYATSRRSRSREKSNQTAVSKPECSSLPESMRTLYKAIKLLKQPNCGFKARMSLKIYVIKQSNCCFKARVMSLYRKYTI